MGLGSPHFLRYLENRSSHSLRYLGIYSNDIWDVQGLILLAIWKIQHLRMSKGEYLHGYKSDRIGLKSDSQFNNNSFQHIAFASDHHSTSSFSVQAFQPFQVYNSFLQHILSENVFFPSSFLLPGGTFSCRYSGSP